MIQILVSSFERPKSLPPAQIQLQLQNTVLKLNWRSDSIGKPQPEPEALVKAKRSYAEAIDTILMTQDVNEPSKPTLSSCVIGAGRVERTLDSRKDPKTFIRVVDRFVDSFTGLICEKPFDIFRDVRRHGNTRCRENHGRFVDVNTVELQDRNVGLGDGNAEAVASI